MAITALRNGKFTMSPSTNFRDWPTRHLIPSTHRSELANVYDSRETIHNAIDYSAEWPLCCNPKIPGQAFCSRLCSNRTTSAQEAKQVARRALTARPKDAAAMNNLAYLLAETGDSLDEAVKLARDAVNEAPNDPVFQDTLGFVYLKRDQNDDALHIFGRLIRRFPNDPVCVYHTGMACFQMGDRARAKTLLCACPCIASSKRHSSQRQRLTESH